MGLLMIAVLSVLSWTDLSWRMDKDVSDFVSLTNGILSVSVPEGVSNVCAYVTADLGGVDYRNKDLEVEVRARMTDCQTYGRPYRGFRVSVHYYDTVAKRRRFPYARKFGDRDFEWEKVSLVVPLCAAQLATNSFPQLVLGIQQASGRAEYDLRTLVVREISPLYPIDDTSYTVKYPDSTLSTPVLRGVMSPGAFRTTEKDIDDLHQMGVTLVRFQMNGFLKFIKERWPNELPSLERWNLWHECWLHHLDQALGWIEARNMKIVIDQHNPPITAKDGVASAFYNEEHANRYVSAWKEIAERYRGRAGVWGYDLINEPIQVKPAAPNCDYWNLQRRAAEAIRSVDPDARLIVESNEGDDPDAFTYLRTLDMDNVIYQAHMYKPHNFTHQGSEGAAIPPLEKRSAYPSLSTPQTLSREGLRRALQPIRNHQLRHGGRIYIGEFSAAVCSPGAAEYLSDCIDIFEEYGWDWTYHSFREARYWNMEALLGENGTSVPSCDNPRYFVLVNGFKPSVPIKVSNRNIRLTPVAPIGVCHATGEIGDARVVRFAAFAAAEFETNGLIGDAISMTVVWRSRDDSEIRHDQIEYRDFCEEGRRYRGFESIVNVPEGASPFFEVELSAANRVGEVRFSGIRAQVVEK